MAQVKKNDTTGVYGVALDEMEKDNSLTANQDAATNIYNNTVTTNQQTANTSYQQADILNQKLAKYIPNYLQSQGINGGLSESFALKQQANTQNLYANINNTLADNNKTAFKTYQNALTSAKQADSETANGILQQTITDNVTNNSGYTLQDIQNIINSDEYKAMTYTDKLAINQQLQPYISNLNISEDEKGNMVESQTKESGNTYSNVSIKLNNTGEYDIDSIVSQLGVNNDAIQRNYLENILKNAKSLKNGDIVNLNYGSSAKERYAVYENGTLKVLLKPTKEQKLASVVLNGYKKEANGNIWYEDYNPQLAALLDTLFFPTGSGFIYQGVKNSSAKRVSSNGWKGVGKLEEPNRFYS